MTAESTRWHEAAHASACVLLGRRVEHVAATPGHGFTGERVGSVSAPIPDEVKRRDLVAALVGYLAESALDWPPSYADAQSEQREALGTLIRALDVSEDEYAACIALSRELLERPDFKRLQSAIARALAAAPELTGEDVERLAAATGTNPQPIGATT